MNSKITAQQLLNVVVDTNKKVTALSVNQNSRSVVKAKTEETRRSKLATTIVILLSFLGGVMLISIFLPSLLETIHLVLSDEIWKIIYFSFATFTIIVATTSYVNTPLRAISSIIAILPLGISSILTII